MGDAMSRHFVSALVVGWAVLAGVGSPLHAQTVTNAQLEKGLADPGAWLNYGGDYGSQRHSPLTQIAPGNVDQLATRWAFQTAQLGKFEATPIVLDGVIYITGPNNTAWAIDARTGRQLWSYRRELPDDMDICCGRVNRGFAVLGNKLYMNTLDAHLLAFDMKTGAVVWDVAIDDYKLGYSATAAPLIVKDKVVVGIAGGGIRHPRVHRRIRCGHGQARLAVLDGARARREGQRDVGRRFLEARRRLHVGHRQLRSRAEPDLLGHRQPGTRHVRRRP